MTRNYVHQRAPAPATFHTLKQQHDQRKYIITLAYQLLEEILL